MVLREDALSGHRVLVTGGGGGLGLMMARAALACGAAVELWGRRAALLEAAARGLGPGARWQAVDIKDPEAVEAAVSRSFDAGHGPTALINNAAGNFVSRSEDLTPRGFRAISDIVIHGTFQVTQALGRRWIASGSGGRVVSILVNWTRTGAPYVVPSAMSKSAIEGMTKSLALEWGPHGIRLNGIAPGLIPTEGMLARIRPGAADPAGKAAQANPLRRIGTAEDIGTLAAFLLSDGAGWITGQTIAMDGAQHMAQGAGTYMDYAAWGDAEWAEARERIKAATAADKAARSA